MNIQQYPLKKGQYFSDLTAKKFVVWHGTAGRTMHTPVSGRPGKATTSIDGWNNNADRVGAPWLVDRDGTVYKTFDDAGWIFHLGIKGTNAAFERASGARTSCRNATPPTSRQQASSVTQRVSASEIGARAGLGA